MNKELVLRFIGGVVNGRRLPLVDEMQVEVDKIDVVRVADWRIVWDELGFRRQLGLPISPAFVRGS